MFPIFYILEFTADSARWLGLAAAVLLSAYIVWDGYRTHGRARLGLTLLQAGAFFAVAFGGAYLLLTPENLPPEFGLPLRTWGLMVVIGMSTCFLVQRWLGREVGLTGDQILTIWVYGGIAALIGARGLHVLVNWSSYAEAPATALNFTDGGMAFIGGALGSLLFSVLYLRRTGAPMLLSLDALVLGIALTHGFGRLGCFFAGCCYGQATDLPWGVSFPVGSIAQYTMAQAGHIAETAATPHVHPTQLYEAGLTFVVGFALLAWHRRRPTPGMIVAGYFLAYPVVRFLLETIRDDPEREFLFRFPAEAPRILSTTQTVSLVLVPVAIAAMIYLRRGGGGGQAAARVAGASGR